MHFDASSFLRVDAPQSLGVTASGASFATSTGDVLDVSCYGPGIFRVRLGPNTKADYGIVDARTKACACTHEDATWRFASGDATLEIAGGPLRLRLAHRNATLLQSITDEHVRGFTRLPAFGRMRAGGQWTASFALASGEAVYGLGAKPGPLDKRGQLVHSQVVDALGVNTGLSHANAPFAWSPGSGKGAWGVFVHTPSYVAHGVGYPDWSHRSYAVMVDDEALDLFLFAADAPAAILDAYTGITGRPPAMPMWSLGLWVSRSSFRTPDEAAQLAAKLRERRIPSDVIALDARAAWDPVARFDFDWDPARFPDPQRTLERIKSHGHRVCVSEWPYLSVHSERFADLASRGYLLATGAGDPYLFQWDAAGGTPTESAVVDFTHPAAYAWWRDAHQALFDVGVDAIEADFGEHVPDDAVASNGDAGARLHNAYPLLYSRCLFEAAAKFGSKPDGPPIVVARGGWAGSQRYSLHRGGEPQGDWEGLAASIRGALSWGMSGGAYHASDIGGSYGSKPLSPVLYVRWLQAAVFGSHMRLNAPGEREPWAFGPQVEAAVRKWLAFRYRLIPYLQHAIAQASAAGLPVMRAMPLAFAGNPLTRNADTQFMCGDALLVAPIVRETGDAQIALPPGGWFDLNTRARVAGNRVIRYKPALDQFPVFGREGFALPLGRAVQRTADIDVARPIERLWVFGKPAQALDGHAQVAIEETDGVFEVRADPGVVVEHIE